MGKYENFFRPHHKDREDLSVPSISKEVLELSRLNTPKHWIFNFKHLEKLQMVEEWSDHTDSEMEFLTRQTLPKLKEIDLWSCSLERDPKFLMKIHKVIY